VSSRLASVRPSWARRPLGDTTSYAPSDIKILP
jgi:hypothetical protein